MRRSEESEGKKDKMRFEAEMIEEGGGSATFHLSGISEIPLGSCTDCYCCCYCCWVKVIASLCNSRQFSCHSVPGR